MKTLLLTARKVWGPHDVYNATSIKLEHQEQTAQLDDLADVEAFDNAITFFNGNDADYLNGKRCLVEVPADLCKGIRA